MSTGRDLAIQNIIARTKGSFDGTEWEVTDQEIKKETSILLELGLDLREFKHSYSGEIKEIHENLITHEEQSKVDLAATCVLIARLSNLKNTRLQKFNVLKKEIEKDVKNSELQYQKLCKEEDIEKKLDEEIIKRRTFCTTHLLNLTKECAMLYNTALKPKHNDFIFGYYYFLFDHNSEYKKLKELDHSIEALANACRIKIEAAHAKSGTSQQMVAGGGTFSAYSTLPSLVSEQTQLLGNTSSSTTTIISTLSQSSPAPSPSVSPSVSAAFSTAIASPDRRRFSMELFQQQLASPTNEKRRNSNSTDDFMIPENNNDNEKKTVGRKLPCCFC